MSQLLPFARGTGRPKPTWVRAEVLANHAYADRYRYLRLHAPSIAALAQPGQFVMVTAAREHEPGPVLPRPMAIYTRATEPGVLDIVYGVVGDGTRALATFLPGERLVLVGPLGQGFVIGEDTDRLLLVGRGVGTCSLTTVAEDLANGPTRVTAVASGRAPDSVIGADVFESFGARSVWRVNDADGSSDVASLRDRLRREFTDRPPQQILTSGSNRLADLCAELATEWDASVQVSVEEHMACGVGYCHGCAIGPVADTHEPPLVCRDGPVFTLAG